MSTGVIKRAHQLYQRRKYAQAVRLLESQVFRFRDDADFYALLGSACIYTGDYGGAESYLRRAEQLKPNNTGVLLGLGAIHFKRGQTEEALKAWLSVLDLDPGNRKAHRALGLLRRSTALENSAALREGVRLRSILPSAAGSRRWWPVPLAVGLVAGGLLAGYFFLLPLLPLLQRPLRSRPGVAEVELSDSQPSLLGQGGNPAFTLTEKQVQELFDQTKSYLLAYRDNLAIREINRILLSNASAYVKEKARLLKTFVQDPDFVTVKDPFPFAAVQADPELYQDTFVVWRGKVANVRIGESEILFDLLVGYEQEKELLGLVPVRLDFACDLESGIALEVLGKVQVSGEQVRLQGLSVHKLYKAK
jgi:tetratricopeptide (TPR) repeat protein